MKLIKRSTIVALFTAVVCSTSYASSDHSTQASKHLSLGASHGVASVAQPVSAVVASPILVSGAVAGSVGAASTRVGATTLNAHNKIPSAFNITEKTITAGPSPDQAIQE
ncbi:hypothetical protein [Marinomonas balearica]|uniref:Killing trait domain-containing protein n=1 Tax=Marinomonas balearica TaxID=491947 RepID=A0A4R6M7W2_9GAMM|nr:hypothetical protein [Marinomonas balearica]TDO96720.1 hypothetical protein DFP79_2485 [Marinomonas balearica]